MRNTMKKVTLFSLCAALSACGGGPEQLAASLDAALKSGEAEPAMKLLDSREIPSQQMFFYVDNVVDCTFRLACTVKVVPLDDKFMKDIEAQKQQGYEFATAPEGLIEITETGEKERGSMTMPYGKVNGAYKILGAHYTAQKLAEARAKTAQSVTDGVLQEGFGDPPDQGWKAHATALPPDGGEPGAAFVSNIKARAEAVKAGDVDKRIAVGDQRDAFIYAAKDYSGKEVPLKLRQFNMRAQFLRELADAKVLGGYRNGDTAVLMFEGHDGNGWVRRGAQGMTLESGKWSAGSFTAVATPAT